jgi:hypothetical protein
MSKVRLEGAQEVLTALAEELGVGQESLDDPPAALALGGQPLGAVRPS